MIELFEYQNAHPFTGDIAELESLLDAIWSSRSSQSWYEQEAQSRSEAQPFLRYLYKTGELKSNNYVGVVYLNGQQINLLPKIFYQGPARESGSDVAAMHCHVLWWLSYCTRIRFPHYASTLGTMNSNFFEVLIYLFARYTRHLLQSSLYQQYQNESSEVSFIKGRVDQTRYIQTNLSTGRWHKINCEYDIFTIDNNFNRIVKCVAKMLLGVTTDSENRKNLREIVFILDEVADVRCTAEQCLGIRFNPMQSAFATVRDYCYLFLKNSVSFSYKNDLQLFAFLLPMEYVFEDFIAGFISREVAGVTLTRQSSAIHLDTDKNYALRPDLILEVAGKRIIADTKYKIIYADATDPKKGISQADLYQMVAYAVRYTIDRVVLFYPDSLAAQQQKQCSITVEDSLAAGHAIRIDGYQLPVINYELLQEGYVSGCSLDDAFEVTREALRERINEIVEPFGIDW
jgi:5-methylcytosine-specific restriction enzyme subunit McrC